MRKVDLNDWEKCGAGEFGVLYCNRADRNLLLKLPVPGIDPELIKKEISRSVKVYEAGLPVPKPGELVTDGERYGMLFRKMPGKISYARAVGENPENIIPLAEKYTGMVKNLHSTPCDKDKFPSVKTFYRESVIGNPFRSAGEKEKALALLESLPDGNTCLHGDLHFGNMIMSGGESYFIDLGNFCYGYPLFDLGMFGALIYFGRVNRERFFNSYHCSVEQATLFWNTFLREYFGRDIDVERKMEELASYIALRIWSVETEINERTPDECTREPFKVFDRI